MHLSSTTAVLLDWGRAMWSPERYMEQQLSTLGGGAWLGVYHLPCMEGLVPRVSCGWSGNKMLNAEQ